MYLTALYLQTNAFCFLKHLFDIQLHGKLVDVLQRECEAFRFVVTEVSGVHVNGHILRSRWATHCNTSSPWGFRWSRSSPPLFSVFLSPGWHSRAVGGSSDREDLSTSPEEDTQLETAGHVGHMTWFSSTFKCLKLTVTKYCRFSLTFDTNKLQTFTRQKPKSLNLCFVSRMNQSVYQ